MTEDYDQAFHYDWLSKRIQKMLDDRDAQFAGHIFPLSVIGEGGRRLYKWFEEYEDYWKAKGAAAEGVGNDAEAEEAGKHAKNAAAFADYAADLIEQYQVSYIELDQELEVDKVCDIFTQINSRGIRLDVFDLVNALLRVRPETLCRITEFSEHESNGRELDEGERVAVEVLPVLGQSAAAVEPGDGAFDHPTPGLDDEALHPIGSLDDLGLEIGQDAGQGAVKDRALIGAVGEQFPEKGKQTEQGRQQRETAVAILNVGGGDDAVQQQALRIDQNMPLLALDQLAGIEAVAVDASPPFSALFTL